MCVQWEGVETHWTDEGDVGGLRVEDVVVGSNPKARVLRQNLHHFERLEIVDEDIWKPELINQLQIDRDHCVGRRGIELLEKALRNMQARLLPQDVEVRAESHRVFLQK